MKVSVENFVKVFLMAALGFAAWKLASDRLGIAGPSQVIGG